MRLDVFPITKDVVVWFEPFVDLTSTSGARVSGDTWTVTILKPNGTTFAGSAPLSTANSVGMRKLTIPLAEVIVGDWSVKIASDAANTGSQFRSVRWG